MKILMIGQLPKEAGGKGTTGVGNVVYELSKCANNDVEFVVYATNMKDNKSRKEGKCFYRGSRIRPLASLGHFVSNPLRAIKEYSYYRNKCGHGTVMRYEAFRDNIQRIIKEEKPDVIHCMSLVQMASTYFANRKYGIPTILTEHGCDPDPNTECGNTIHLPDVVTGLTPQTMEDIAVHGIPKEKTVMVPNGTDTQKFYYSEEERIRLRKELGVDDQATVMLTIGSLCHRKGQYTMLSKIKELPSSFKYLYLIIGKGEDYDKIVAYINENQLQDRVRVIGYVANNELYRYHSAADVYVHCSRSEGQALSEVEAYATDLKTVVNRDVATTIVTDINNKDDYLVFDFDTFDVNDFVSWASLHKKHRHTRSKYDWNEIFGMYVEVYKKLLKVV